MFRFEVPGVHRSTQTVTDAVPGRRISWRVSQSHLSFVADPAEWDDTEMVFDLTATDGGTELRFTHVGLRPAEECYDICSAAWHAATGG